MRIRYFLVSLMILALNVSPLWAQEEDILFPREKMWQTDQNNAALEEDDDENSSISMIVEDDLPFHALRNMTQAEQVFCYHVRSEDDKYEGYTIDGMAISGFCGILEPAEVQIFVDNFLGRDENISTVVSNCIITPRIMLRFIYGVDYTDVLFSSPCESFSVFYGGTVKTFNLSPAAPIVQEYIQAYETRKIDFVSPALLKQVMPIGLPQNEEQRMIVREKTSPKPVRNWVGETTSKTTQTPKSEAPKTGWNKLKFAR